MSKFEMMIANLSSTAPNWTRAMHVVFCSALPNLPLKESSRMTFDVVYVQHGIERQIGGIGKKQTQGSPTGSVVICRKKTEKNRLDWGR
jgi:hypothetical protein